MRIGEREAAKEGGFFARNFGHSHGAVKAYSLAVTIKDMQGNPVYLRNGGIQVLNKLDGDRLTAVPRTALFANDEQNARSVDIALRPVMKQHTDAVARQAESPAVAGMMP